MFQEIYVDNKDLFVTSIGIYRNDRVVAYISWGDNRVFIYGEEGYNI